MCIWATDSPGRSVCSLYVKPPRAIIVLFCIGGAAATSFPRVVASPSPRLAPSPDTRRHARAGAFADVHKATDKASSKECVRRHSSVFASSLARSLA